MNKIDEARFFKWITAGDSEISENHPIFGDKGKTYCEKIIDDWFESLAEHPEILERAVEDAKGVKETAAELVALRHGLTVLLSQMPTQELRDWVHFSVMAGLQEIIATMGMENDDSADWWKESRQAELIVSFLLESE